MRIHALLLGRILYTSLPVCEPSVIDSEEKRKEKEREKKAFARP